ncbi:MAG: hypothetical protein KIG32_00715 [Ruminiclostridium sp.]|nr:hypothetical protein [Ruminiclostridium sp.]
MQNNYSVGSYDNTLTVLYDTHEIRYLTFQASKTDKNIMTALAVIYRKCV